MPNPDQPLRQPHSQPHSQPQRQRSIFAATAGFAACLAVLASVFLGPEFSRALAQSGTAPRASEFASAEEAQSELERARQEASAARQRVLSFRQQASDAEAAAQRTKAETAMLAASVQQAEAAIAIAEAELALVRGQRGMIESELAARREPIVRLTGALQRLVQRPLSFSLLRPGSLRETVYLGAVLDSTIPQVRARTAALRSDLGRIRQLEDDAQNLIAARRETESELDEARQRLAAQAERQRRASRSATGNAGREARRALAMAEKARDLSGLIGQLEKSGGLRAELALLPGPLQRPANLGQAAAANDTAERMSPQELEAARDRRAKGESPAPNPYRLPVNGRVTAGFGERSGTASASSGLTLAARSEAQVITPASGRVAFAGPYRGYGEIVIIEHAGGWTSLITGLGNLAVEVGDRLDEGSPVGEAALVRAGAGGNVPVTLELRRAGKPVNPLEFLAR